jgi:hypothetical protein
MKTFKKFKITCNECMASWEFESKKKLTVSEMEDICWGCDSCEAIDVTVVGIE